MEPTSLIAFLLIGAVAGGFVALSVGTGIGPIIARRFTGDRDRALRYGILFGFASHVISMAIIAPLNSFTLVLVGVLFRGIGGGIVWVFSTQLLLQNVTGNVRGRVFATEFMLNPP